MIVGQNALLNQYVPTFFIKDLRDGQGVVYDSVRKAFVNVDLNGGSGGAASGLEQSASGLKISDNGVTNAMLVNDGFTTNADTGTGTIALGEDLEIAGSSVQGIATSVAGSVFTISGINASTTQKGVASFDSSNFSVTAGAVSIAAGGVDLTTDVTGVLPVANGGTGAVSFTAGRVLLGNGTTNITEDSDLAFNAGTNTLTIGTATIQGGAPDVTITATGTDGDIILMPNGIGAVVVGPAGAGTIASDTGETLTITGDGGLTLESGTGDIVLTLSGTTANKVTVSGPTATEYATSLANEDLVNKYYVDNAISSGGTGDVKAVQATVSLTSATSTNIGAALPAGATVLSVKVNVTVASDAVTTVVVGKSGGNQYMTATENDPEVTGLYLAETMVTEAGSEQVQATVATPGSVGSCVVVVTYKLA